jgi:hypothetical protein
MLLVPLQFSGGVGRCSSARPPGRAHGTASARRQHDRLCPPARHRARFAADQCRPDAAARAQLVAHRARSIWRVRRARRRSAAAPRISGRADRRHLLASHGPDRRPSPASRCASTMATRSIRCSMPASSGWTRPISRRWRAARCAPIRCSRRGAARPRPRKSRSRRGSDCRTPTPTRRPQRGHRDLHRADRDAERGFAHGLRIARCAACRGAFGQYDQPGAGRHLGDARLL